MERRRSACGPSLISGGNASDGIPEGTLPTGKTVRNKGKRGKQQEDIFKEFGKEHDPNAMKQVEIGGVSSKRVNFRKHWNSDPEINRWQKSLHDNNRFDRLLGEVRHRWHPDFCAERTELIQKHNALFRQRFAAECEKMESPSPSAAQVRDLQKCISPKTKTNRGTNSQKKATNFDATSLEATHLGTGPVFLGGNLRVNNAIRRNSVARSEAMSSASQSDAGTPRRASLYSDEGTVVACAEATVPAALNEPQGHEGHFDPSRPRRDGHTPQTLSLLVFRNGDRSHAGEAIFVKRTPGHLAPLILILGQACKPIIGPAGALFDPALSLVRDLSEVRNGGAYLLKGQEGFAPPPLFFAQRPDHASFTSPSLRNMANVGHHVAVQRLGVMEIESHKRAQTSHCSSMQFSAGEQGEEKSCPHTSQSTTSKASQGWQDRDAPPRVGSPPHASDTDGPGGEMWKTNPALAVHFTNGGLGQLPRHHRFDAWAAVRRRPSSCPAASMAGGL